MHKSLYILSAVLFFSAITIDGSAQRKNDDNNYINGTEYAHKGDKRAKEKGDETELKANVVKFSLLSWISGGIPFYYERRVTPWLGLQFGLGLTTRDFVADALNDIIEGLRYHPPADYNKLAFYGLEGRKSSVGIYASFQPKFYPRQKALTGFFVSPMVEFKQYNFTAAYTDPTAVVEESETPVYTTSKMREYRNAIDFTVNLGRQWLLPSNVSLELMGGVGFRKFWEQRREISSHQAYNINTGNNGYAYTTYTQFSTTYRPEFNLSFMIGGCF